MPIIINPDESIAYSPENIVEQQSIHIESIPMFNTNPLNYKFYLKIEILLCMFQFLYIPIYIFKSIIILGVVRKPQIFTKILSVASCIICINMGIYILQNMKMINTQVIIEIVNMVINVYDTIYWYRVYLNLLPQQLDRLPQTE